jgi:transcriptional regulator with XRE-family HTH domain|tara:strand:+ start:423 stop:599 length:177 start_codon:yes stop_codon:yes gene_type:complete
MLNLEEIKLRLGDRRLDSITKATGLSKVTIINIREGRNTDPKYNTLQKLSDYFEGQEK